MKQLIILISFISLFPTILVSQEFGCLDIPSQMNGIYSKSQFYMPIDWTPFDIYHPTESTLFDIHQPPNGEYIEYFDSSSYYPIKIRMHGEIKNGKKHGKWTLSPNEYTNYTGIYLDNQKQGNWIIEYFYNDELIKQKDLHFLNDRLHGMQIRYSQSGVITDITNYYHGKKDGVQIKYFDNDTINQNKIKRLSTYKSDVLDGVSITYNSKGDTTEYSDYKDGKLNGVQMHYNYKDELTSISSYKNGKLSGAASWFNKNHQIYYSIDFKNNLPYNILVCNDTNGVSVDFGTFKNGTGTLKTFYTNRQLKTSFEYKNQLLNGKMIRYYKNGDLKESGVIYTDSSYSYKRPYSLNWKSINSYSTRKQNFTKNTNFTMYKPDGGYTTVKAESKLDTTIIVASTFTSDSILIWKSKRWKGLLIDSYECYYENGEKEKIGNYKIIKSETGEYKSVRDGFYFYYYPNGNAHIQIEYRLGSEINSSYYYDEEGILRRTKTITKSELVYNIFNSDTVNITDENGHKQGKWINLSSYTEGSSCMDIKSIEYYEDDKPVGTWEYYSIYKPNSLPNTYTWINPILASVTYNHQNIIIEGFIVDMEIRVGQWKSYNKETGEMIWTGSYRNRERDGIWKFYKKNGNLKKTVTYENGEVITNKRRF